MRIASMDIGSNSALMLIAEFDENTRRWIALEDHESVTRISEGLDGSGVLSEAPIKRTEAQLERYAQRAAEVGVDRVLAAGTAPFRRARNGREVAARLSRGLGVSVDVLSGEAEASLSLLSTQRAFPELREMLVIDIGGASTELIFRREGEASPAIFSVDIGSVRLTERCVTAHPFAPGDRDALHTTITAALSSGGLNELLRASPPTIVGIAGTVTTLAALSLELEAYDASRIHGHHMSLSEVERLAIALSHLSTTQRASLEGVSSSRADVIAAGAWLLHDILKQAGAQQVIVSDRGVRWGRLYEVLS